MSVESRLEKYKDMFVVWSTNKEEGIIELVLVTPILKKILFSIIIMSNGNLKVY